MLAWISLLFSIFFNATGSILIKNFSNKNSTFHFLQFLNWEFIVGAGCFGLGLVFYSLALRQLELSSAYITLIAGSAILVLLASLLFFGEELSYKAILGCACVLIGLILIGQKN